MRECSKCKQCFADEVTICPQDGTETNVTFSGPPLINGRYRLTNYVGGSTLGRLYLAQDENLAGREVALRIIESPQMDSPGWIRLASKVASVQNQNVVEITDFGEAAEGSYFVVSERMTAGTLNSLIRRVGKLGLKRSVDLLKQIAGGIGAIHEKGLMHGALNPDNVFVESKFSTLGGSAEEEFVRISDFGWGELRTINAVQDMAAAVAPVAGEIEFLAPEQVQPDAPMDQRIDTYGLGALAFYLLSGRLPFNGDLMQVVVQKTMGGPQSLKKLSPEIPESIANLVTAALSRNPLERPSEISEWMAQFERAAGSAIASAGAERPPEVMVVGPAGTTVYLDDEEQGEISAGGEFSLIMIQPGVHMVRVRYPDGSDDERLLEVSASSATDPMRLDFTQAGSDAKPNATPTGGEVAPVHVPTTPQSDAPRSPPAVSDPSSITDSASPMVQPQIATPQPDENIDGVATEADKMNCPKCGGEIRATSKFCRICGAAVSPAAGPMAAQPAPSSIGSASSSEAVAGHSSIETPAPIVESPPVAVADKRPDITDTMDSAGGLKFEIPEAVSPPTEPRERPKTVESPLAASAIEAAAEGQRSTGFYVGIGMVIGLVLLIVLGLVGVLIYWFVLPKAH